MDAPDHDQAAVLCKGDRGQEELLGRRCHLDASTERTAQGIEELGLVRVLARWLATRGESLNPDHGEVAVGAHGGIPDRLENARGMRLPPADQLPRPRG